MEWAICRFTGLLSNVPNLYNTPNGPLKSHRLVKQEFQLQIFSLVQYYWFVYNEVNSNCACHLLDSFRVSFCHSIFTVTQVRANDFYITEVLKILYTRIFWYSRISCGLIWVQKPTLHSTLNTINKTILLLILLKLKLSGSTSGITPTSALQNDSQANQNPDCATLTQH